MFLYLVNKVSNTYAARNGSLSQSRYGNGDTVGYSYDRFGRLSEKSYNGMTAVRYGYTASGGIGFLEDLLLGTSTRYTYDLADRLVRTSGTNGLQTFYGYDDYSRLKSFSYSYQNGAKRISGYTYDNETGLYYPSPATTTPLGQIRECGWGYGFKPGYDRITDYVLSCYLV